MVMNKLLEDSNANEPYEEAGGDDTQITRALVYSLLLIVPVIVIVGGIVWWLSLGTDQQVTQASELVQPTKRDVAQLQPPQLPLVDVTLAAGITFKHYAGARGEKLLPETMGGGVAFFDYDGDGDPDLLFVNGSDWPWTKD